MWRKTIFRVNTVGYFLILGYEALVTWLCENNIRPTELMKHSWGLAFLLCQSRSSLLPRIWFCLVLVSLFVPVLLHYCILCYVLVPQGPSGSDAGQTLANIIIISPLWMHFWRYGTTLWFSHYRIGLIIIRCNITHTVPWTFSVWSISAVDIFHCNITVKKNG